jgi:hypothetical protein
MVFGLLIGFYTTTGSMVGAVVGLHKLKRMMPKKPERVVEETETSITIESLHQYPDDASYTSQHPYSATQVAPPWYGNLSTEPASVDSHEAKYDTLWANRGKAKDEQSTTDGGTITLYENGTLEQKNAAGVQIITFEDKTRCQKNPDGTIIHAYKVRGVGYDISTEDGNTFQIYANGVTQEVIKSEEGNTLVQTQTDGSRITQQPDGSKVSEGRKDLPGGCIVQQADGTVIQSYGKDSAQGHVVDTITKYTDGTQVQVNRDGSYITTHPKDDPPPENHPVKWTEKDDGTYQEQSYPTWGPHQRALPDYILKQIAEDEARKKAAEEAERARIDEAEAAKRAEAPAKLDAEEAKRKRIEEATAWFYELNYMEIKKWLAKNKVPHNLVMQCLGIYELRQLAIHQFGENFMLKMEKA